MELSVCSLVLLSFLWHSCYCHDVELLAQLLQRYFRCQNTVTFTEDPENLALVRELSASNSAAVSIVNLSSTAAIPTGTGCSDYLVLSDSAANISALLETRMKLMHQSRVIVISNAVDPREVLSNGKVRRVADFLLCLRKSEHRYHLLTHQGLGSSEPRLLDYWKRRTGFQYNTTLLPQRRNNLHGCILKVGVVSYAPSVIVTTDEHGTKYSGIEFSILEALATYMNFTVVLEQVSEEEKWGEFFTGNQSFNGLLGLLQFDRIDLGLGGIWIQPARKKLTDLTVPYMITHDCFLVPAPKPLPQWIALYLPFTVETWLATLGAILASVVALYTIAKIAARFTQTESFLTKKSNLILYLTGNILQVQQPNDPVFLHSRAFLLFWFFFVTIVPSVYRSALTSYLAIPLYPKPIDTIEALAQSPLKKTVFGDTFKKVAMNSTYPALRKLGEQMVVNYDLNWALHQVLNGEVATSAGFEVLKYTADSNFTHANGQWRVHIVKECLLPAQVAIGLPKYSILTKELDRFILRQAETGFINYYQNHLTSTRKSATESFVASSTLKPFSLESLQGAFLLYGLGILASVAAFLGEILVSAYRKRLTRK